ncbi:MAG TPA: HAMP domain-containing sensor histidine kinase [Acidothermaceae bacterium]
MKTTVPLRPALRVAAAATLAVALCYIVIVAGILALVSNRLLHETDNRLTELLRQTRNVSVAEFLAKASIHDADDPPAYVWEVRGGAVVATSAGAPALPSTLVNGSQARYRSVSIAGHAFRFRHARQPDGSTLYAAESLVQQHHVRSVLLMAAFAVSPLLLAGVFASAFVIGRSASKPVEQARVRQLEFTADASHELRTPLTVIEAEVGLALVTERSAGGYRDALQRVSGETHRLRKIVEDMLWLARFDSEPPPPRTELVDVTTVVQQCVDRFEPVVKSRNIKLSIEVAADAPALIAAAPEWLDRLIGVLLDNATRYAKSAGHVVVRVDGSSGHVALTVSDDGPGIPLAERQRLFDRFRRIEDNGGEGAGLGLAIADAVVRSTQGRWAVGESTLGGARMTVIWPRPRSQSATRLPSLRS